MMYVVLFTGTLHVNSHIRSETCTALTLVTPKSGFYVLCTLTLGHPVVDQPVGLIQVVIAQLLPVLRDASRRYMGTSQ